MCGILLAQLTTQVTISLNRELDYMNDAPATPSDWLPKLYELAVVLGNQYPLIAGLLLLIALDIATGLAKGFVTKELSSQVSRRGIYQKIMMLASVAAAWSFEFVFPKIGGQTVPWGQMVAGGFWILEIVSILENAGKAGVPLPKALLEALAKYRESMDTKVVVQTEIKPDSNVTNVNVSVNPPSQDDQNANKKAFAKVNKRMDEMDKLKAEQAMNPDHFEK